MAAPRNILRMTRLFSSLAHNNHAYLSPLNRENSCRLPAAPSLVFTRSDFHRRGLQTQTNSPEKADNDSENHDTGCSQPDSAPRNPPSELSSSNSSNDNSSPKHSVISSLKPSARHDLAMFFTCNVCETRHVKTVCRESYEKGVVIVRCGGCNNLHLIADRLGWFGDPSSVEDFLAMRGEEVRKGSADTMSLTLDDLAGKKILND